MEHAARWRRLAQRCSASLIPGRPASRPCQPSDHCLHAFPTLAPCVAGAISMTGPSPNAKDPKGTLVTTYTLLPDGTLQLTMHISRGDGSELLIRRILERAD